jgi:hypothetical protein
VYSKAVTGESGLVGEPSNRRGAQTDEAARHSMDPPPIAVNPPKPAPELAFAVFEVELDELFEVLAAVEFDDELVVERP